MSTKLVPWRRHTEGATPDRFEQPFMTLQRQMNRLFGENLDNIWGGSLHWPAIGGLMRQVPFETPRVDIAETDTEVQVAADLPGLDEKDVQVTLEENLLTIHGEKKVEHEEKKKNYHLMERSYGAFQREIPLPAGIDTKKVKASFKKGVLQVTLPKLPDAQSRRQQIKVEKE
jgi:HSP20 family protein